MNLQSNMNDMDKYISSLTQSTEKEIIKAYAQSLKVIRSQLAEVYAKYATNETLTYADMIIGNRLRDLNKQVTDELIKLTNFTANTINNGLQILYSEAYYYTAFALESVARVDLSYAVLNPLLIQRAVENPLKEIALKTNRTKVITSINSDIAQGLILGKSYQQIAKNIKNSLESNTNNALRISRTETHRVQNEALIESGLHAQSKGVEMVKVWDAAKDSRTRDTHQDLDGVKVNMDEDFISGSAKGKAPGHLGKAAEDINCRCRVRFEIAGYEPELMRARNPITGKNELVPYKTYNNWKQERL